MTVEATGGDRSRSADQANPGGTDLTTQTPHSSTGAITTQHAKLAMQHAQALSSTKALLMFLILLHT